jgi:hypothetical protein
MLIIRFKVSQIKAGRQRVAVAMASCPSILSGESSVLMMLGVSLPWIIPFIKLKGVTGRFIAGPCTFAAGLRQHWLDLDV